MELNEVVDSALVEFGREQERLKWEPGIKSLWNMSSIHMLHIVCRLDQLV